jgi:lysophospholipase L1-like esterase
VGRSIPSLESGRPRPSERPWPRRLRGAAASGALSLLVALVAGEAWVRATHAPEIPDALAAASLEYESTLFARHAFPQRERIVAPGPDAAGGSHINARGTRGPDFAAARPAGGVRVLVLGGSAAFDPAAPEGEDWPRQLESRLRAQGLTGVEVINAGTPGHASLDSLGRLATELWMFEPDVVVLYHGWNDLKLFAELSPERSLLRRLRPPPRAEGSDLVWNPFLHASGPLDHALLRSQLYVRLRRRYLEWRLGLRGPEGLLRSDPADAARQRRGEGLPDAFSPWAPRQLRLTQRLLAEAARAARATPVFVTEPRLLARSNGPAERARMNLAYLGLSHAGAVAASEALDAAILASAAEVGAPALDLGARFGGRGELFLDHVHLSRAGSRAVAAAVADFLAPRVRALALARRDEAAAALARAGR